MRWISAWSDGSNPSPAHQKLAPFTRTVRERPGRHDSDQPDVPVPRASWFTGCVAVGTTLLDCMLLSAARSMLAIIVVEDGR